MVINKPLIIRVLAENHTAMLITLSGHNPQLFSGGLQSTNAADNSVSFQGDARALEGQMDSYLLPSEAVGEGLGSFLRAIKALYPYVSPPCQSRHRTEHMGSFRAGRMYHNHYDQTRN